MKNNDNMTMDEKLFEAMLKIATDEALREEMDALPSDEELNKMYPRTKTLDKKVNAVIKREYRVVRRKNAVRILTRITALLCAIVVICAIPLMAIETSRNFILNALVEFRGDYVTLDFGKEESPDIIENNGIILGYLPEGFELISSQSMEGLIINVYTDDTGNMLIAQKFIGGDLFVGTDNEYTEFLEIQLDVGNAYFFEAFDDSGKNKIMWTQGDDVITITAVLDLETLVKIADNLFV